MDWKEFFDLKVMKNGPDGFRPYFHAVLKVHDDFQMEELQMKKFDHWGLSEDEKRRLSLGMRKLLLCLHYFNSVEFERIFMNFIDRLAREKSQNLCFSTTGGGIYLFLALVRAQGHGLYGKSISCFSSEIPLPVMKLPEAQNLQLRLIYATHAGSYLAQFPSLFQQSDLLNMIEKTRKNCKVA